MLCVRGSLNLIFAILLKTVVMEARSRIEPVELYDPYVVSVASVLNGLMYLIYLIYLT